MAKDMKQRIGFLLQKARKEQKLTQADVAEFCGLSVEAVSNIERGANYPSFDNLFSICNCLKCSCGEILSDAADNKKNELRRNLEFDAVSVIRRLSDGDLKIVARMLTALKD